MRKMTMIVAAIAALGLLVAAPMASAKSKTSKTDKSQNKAIKKNAKGVKNAAAGVKKNTKAIDASTKGATAAINALAVIANRGDKTSATVAAAAPAIIQGLTDLKNGLTQAAAGLNSLKTLTGSQEYGYVQPSESIGGTTTQLGFQVTPDIPDIPQLSQTEQTYRAPAAGTVTTQYGIRSNETDGDGTTAAANCSVTMFNVTAPNSATQALTAVTNKASLAATAPSAGAILAGTDQPQSGPSINVSTGDIYTIKMTCIDQTPISASDPGA